MKDYLHDPDDYAHLAADCPPCRECRHFWPTGMMGWASAGRIHGRREGRCDLLETDVDGDLPWECDRFEGRP